MIENSKTENGKKKMHQLQKVIIAKEGHLWFLQTQTSDTVMSIVLFTQADPDYEHDKHSITWLD